MNGKAEERVRRLFEAAPTAPDRAEFREPTHTVARDEVRRPECRHTEEVQGGGTGEEGLQHLLRQLDCPGGHRPIRPGVRLIPCGGHEGDRRRPRSRHSILFWKHRRWSIDPWPIKEGFSKGP